MCLYARYAVTSLAKPIWNSQMNPPSALNFRLCRLFRVRIPPAFVLERILITATERANADWEYFTIAPYMKPHFVSDGSGAYELIATVSFGTTVRHRTLLTCCLAQPKALAGGA